MSCDASLRSIEEHFDAASTNNTTADVMMMLMMAVIVFIGGGLQVTTTTALFAMAVAEVVVGSHAMDQMAYPGPVVAVHAYREDSIDSHYAQALPS